MAIKIIPRPQMADPGGAIGRPEIAFEALPEGTLTALGEIAKGGRAVVADQRRVETVGRSARLTGLSDLAREKLSLGLDQPRWRGCAQSPRPWRPPEFFSGLVM